VVRFSITKKFVFAFLILSILPLCALGISMLYYLRVIGQRAIDSSTVQLENRAKEALEVRTIELGNQVTQFLQSCEADLLTLKMLPREPDIYRQFSRNHCKTIWTSESADRNVIEVHREIPLYREVAFIGADGTERVRIVQDRIEDPSELRDVSKSENTTFKSERYFAETRKLAAGEIYVSHVTGWFVPLKQQGAYEHGEVGEKDMSFEGVIRFATPCVGKNGEFEGIVMISLDHRHLMELTLHILPTDERFAVFPSYSSGNYAFMFDDEGWIICHPKYYDIRGMLPDGREIDPSGPEYTRDRLIAGEIPFHLDHTRFINTNYPFIAGEVRAGRSGVTNTFNVAGTQRVMAYAPIFYQRIPYNKYGIFGGITIGVETAKFREPALLASSKIDEIVAQTKQSSLVILASTAFAAILLGLVLARRFTTPILYLARKARDIATGEITDDIEVRTGDEVEFLAMNFGRMARKIRKHQESLERSFDELAESKKSVEQYSRQLEEQLKVLRTVHYLSQYLSTVYDRELVLQTVLRTCVEGLGYDRAMLYLYDPLTRRLICHQTFGFCPHHEQKAMDHSYHIDRHQCIPTKVFRSGETIFVQNVRTDDRATPLDLRIAEGGETDCFVFTPVKGRDRAIGVLGADTKTTRRRIEEMAVESLEILANDAARAIERSELYRELVSERNFIKSIVTHMTSGIITLDEAGKVTWFNPYSEEIFKIRPEDALGKHYRDVFAAIPSWIALVDGHLNSEHRQDGTPEVPIVFPDGKEKILAVHSSRINQDQPQQTIVSFFVRDVTQRKQLEEHMRRSDRLVSLGVLAAGIAHEMRNPLTGLSLVMDDLHDHLHDRPMERDLIQKSLQEIDRLENLINGLLDFAVPSRKVNLQVRPFGDVLTNTLFLVRKLCKNQGIALSVAADERLPLLNMDPERLQQAILNLLLNAIQAMPTGGSLQVETKGIPEQESLLSEPAVRIAITDTGKGITPEDIPYIFDPFFTRTPSGCGLGLAIVHSIVQEHEGRVSVFSKLGQGTTFWVDLPVATEELDGENTHRR
jgi:PAS domain S-box-containing protein